MLIAVVVVALFSPGCDGPLATSQGKSKEAALADHVAPLSFASQDSLGKTQDRIDIDAGIIFANETSYFCFPLSRFGIQDVADIQEIETSCECVSAVLVKCNGVNESTVACLKLVFGEHGETKSLAKASTDAPSLLAVELKLTLFDGRTCVAIVRFLLTNG